LADTVEYNNIDENPGIYSFTNAALVNYAPGGTKGKQQLWKNQPQVTKYGLKIRQFDTYILRDAVAKKLAQYYATFTKAPKTLVQSIDFTALALGSLYPDFLETELQDLCIVKRTTVDGRNLTFNLVIEGFRYRITPDNWEVTYYTGPISATKVILP
jgi:hypothetical protein